MSKNFPPAPGRTANAERRRNCPNCGTSANPDPMSTFCGSLSGQRTLDIDMLGVDEHTGEIIWVMEAAGLPHKTCTVAYNLAQKLGVPFIYLYYNYFDHEHVQVISYHTHIPPRPGEPESERRLFTYQGVSWKKLEFHLKWIARRHRSRETPEHYAVSLNRLPWDVFK